jgi:hypothetical protein
MLVFIPADMLFTSEIRCHCRGVASYENQAAAAEKTARLRNTLAKNQYFSAAVPDETTFISTGLPLAQQPAPILERVLSDSSLPLLYAAEGKDFMGRLDACLTETGSSSGPEAVQAEIIKFYNQKRDAIKSLDASAYLDLIERSAKAHDPATVSAYLSHIGISGLVSGDSAGPRGRVFFLVNPRRDAVIREIIRIAVPKTGSAS